MCRSKKTALASAVLLVLLSFGCSKSPQPEPPVALKSVTLTPKNQAISYRFDCTLSDTKVTNDADPIPDYITKEELNQSRLYAETTLGLGIEAYYNGTKITKEGVVVDAGKAIPIEVRGYGKTRTYTIQPVRAAVSPAEGTVSLISSDMRKMGIADYITDFTVTLYRDRFYCFATGVNDGVAEYELYSSNNGVKWDRVEYQPHELGAIGGIGCRAVVKSGRLFVLGGARTEAPDRWGVPQEKMSWGGLPDISAWRSFSTADGVSFACDTVGLRTPWQQSWGGLTNPSLPSPAAFVNAIVQDGKIYFKNSYIVGFGQLQGSRSFMTTEDGKHWENLPAMSEATGRLQDAFFAFRGKLWTAGGFFNYIGKDSGEESVYSTSDGGQTWVKETDQGGFGKMWGMTPFCTDDTAYMIGGELMQDGQRVLSDKLYKSTDGKSWTEVDTGTKYTARRSPQVVVKDGYAYIFGGYTTASTQNYGFDLKTSMNFETYILKL